MSMKPNNNKSSKIDKISVEMQFDAKRFLSKFLYVMRGQHQKLILMVCVFVLISCMDLLGVGLVGPYMGAVVNPDVLNRFPIVVDTLSLLGVTTLKSQIVVLGVVLMAVFLVKSISSYVAQSYVFKFSFRFRSLLVNRLMCSYIFMPYKYYLVRNSASIVQSVLANTKVMADDLLIPFLRLCSDALILIFIGVFMLYMSPQAMFLLVGLLGATIYFYFRIVKPRVRVAGEVTAVANEGVIRGVNQAIGGIKEIRASATEKYFINAIDRAGTECADAQFAFMRLLMLPKYMMELVLVLFVIVFSMYVTWSGEGQEDLVSTLAMFAVAGIRILPALSQISSSVVSLNYSSHALDAVCNDISLADKIETFSTSKNGVKGQPFESAELKDVSFSYVEGERPVVDRVCLSLCSGQSVALIGESGAGKTTLVDVLLGLHDFQSGSFKVNGIDIASFGWNRWRDHVAYIPQNVFLTDDTLENNIAFGLGSEDVDRKRISEAIEWAQLTNLVERLPMGLHTVLGERGIRLSGGERQRIALARAFYSGRDVLILDEATSALDYETERQVVDVIDSLKGMITLVVIAHRLSTVRNCDVIYRLDKGQIVASGSFDEVVGGAS